MKQYLDELSSLEIEKERRQYYYDNVAEERKAEFINAEVVFHLPDTKKENSVAGRLMILLDSYVSKRQLGFVASGKIIVQMGSNDFEPDICFFRKEVADTFSDKTMFFPAPDFAVKILSKSTEKNDRGVKFVDYAFNGVREYWIIDVDDDTVEQYFLNDEKKYQLLVKINEGFIYSKSIPGFNIPVLALFNEAANNETLKQLL